MKVHELFEGVLKYKNLIHYTHGNQIADPEEDWRGSLDVVGLGLVSLEGAPRATIGKTGDFLCRNNELTSLEFAPKIVEGDFWCDNNKLTSLEFSPEQIGREVSARRNKLSSLHNIHKQIKSIGHVLDVRDNPIKSHILGVVKIEGLKKIWMDNEDVMKIINKYLPTVMTEGGIIECQQELIEAGFDEYAQL